MKSRPRVMEEVEGAEGAEKVAVVEKLKASLSLAPLRMAARRQLPPLREPSHSFGCDLCACPDHPVVDGRGSPGEEEQCSGEAINSTPPHPCIWGNQHQCNSVEHSLGARIGRSTGARHAVRNNMRLGTHPFGAHLAVVTLRRRKHERRRGRRNRGWSE